MEAQVTITLSELNQIYRVEQSQDQDYFLRKSIPFAVYLSSNRYLLQNQSLQQLYTKDMLAFPVLPIRRNACQSCLLFNLQCQSCQSCHKSQKTCCRSLNCVYQLRNYLKNRQDQGYRKCDCMGDFQPSTYEFSIDWRLLYLLQKLGTVNTIKYNYFLHYKANTLLITEQEIGQQQTKSHINRTIFEQSFTAQPDSQDSKNLKDQNMINLQGLFETNIRRYVKEYEDWDQSDIELSCYEIVESFLMNKQLQNFKRKMQAPSFISEHDYISGYSVSRPKKYINVTQSTGKINYNKFAGFSSAINKDIVFFYHQQLNALAVKNAAYDQKDLDRSSTKIYEITDLVSNLKEATWFKDRKGDIFAIHNQFISVFKFHLKTKKFKQIILREDSYFLKLRKPISVLYVPETDRVYYFEAKNFGMSFYFQLYRPYQQQKEFSNCLSVNPRIPLPRRLPVMPEFSFLKMNYAIQEVILTSKEKKVQKYVFKKEKQCIPVIYLLAQKQQGQFPCLYRLIHHQSHYQLSQVQVQVQLQQKLTFDSNLGIFRIFKKEKQLCVCYQTQLNGVAILIQGKLVNEAKLKVDWEIRYLCGFSTFDRPHYIQGIPSEDEKTMKLLQKLNSSTESFKNANDDIMLLNDLAGSGSNNMSRYLVFLPRENKLSELIISLHEGDYSWSLQQHF